MIGGIEMNSEINAFINKYVKEIRNNNAAFFAGAGFSKESGYIDWKTLLESIASELGLEVEKEHDLVALAQYCYNKHQNRGIINDVIFEEFSKQKEPTQNHRILARLPIGVIWTTNYDDLIEKAFDNVQKIVDVKSRNEHLSNTLANRECILYKMHGDKNNPNDAILIKDDYERYYKAHKQFLSALTGDLISKTFLFVGFSFQDPNLDYILSRIRVDYEENPRQHYAIMKSIDRKDYESDADYDYAKRRNDLFLEDLKRYRISALVIDDFSEITEILQEIERRLNQNNIFISGSAEEYGVFTKEEAENLIKLLSARLIQDEFNIISGFGVGVGSAVITGALEEIYMHNTRINNQRLLLRPFPQGKEARMLWQQYREDMISRAGISIYIFGNKKQDDNIVEANGVKTEFDIAIDAKHIVIPVGCTGYMAQKLWEQINLNIEEYYGKVNDEVRKTFQSLNTKMSNDEIVSNIVKLIKLLRR